MADKRGIRHDRLRRLRRVAGSLASLLVRLLIGLAQSRGHPGWLILDEVWLPHRRGKQMAGVYGDYDHADQKHRRGMRVVVRRWTEGWLRLPVAFAVWHKKGRGLRRYRSKNALARLRVRWGLHRGLRPSEVTVDAGYAAQQNLRCFSRWGRWWVTRIKKNARLTGQGQALWAKTIGRRRLQARRPYTFRQLAVQGRSTWLDGGRLRELTFVGVQHDLAGEKTSRKYLLSNQPLAPRQLIERYKSRWVVEVFFRDCKQPLGLSAYQGRTWEGAMGHLTLVFLAAVVSDVLKDKELTVGAVKKTTPPLIVLQDAHGHTRLAVQRLPDWSDPTLLAKAQRLIKSQLKVVSPLRVPKLKRKAA